MQRLCGGEQDWLTAKLLISLPIGQHVLLRLYSEVSVCITLSKFSHNTYSLKASDRLC